MSRRLSKLFNIDITPRSDGSQPPFDVGQVWQLTRGDQIGCKLHIVMIEPFSELGSAVHVRVEGPLYTNKGHVLAGIPHLPFLASALEATSLQFMGYEPPSLELWREMYDDWLGDVDAGEASLLCLPVDETLTEIMARLPV